MELSKEKYGMSPFWKDLIWLSVFVGISLFMWFHPFAQKLNTGMLTPAFWALRMFSIIFVWLKIWMIHEEIGDETGVAFKIIEEGKGWGKTYKAKVFRSRLLFVIWWWAPVKKKYEFWEGKNFFGGPAFGGYSWEKTWSSEEKAREAIKKYKSFAKSEIREYFERPKKKVKKKIKL